MDAALAPDPPGTFNLVGTITDKGWLHESLTCGGYYLSPRWLKLARILAEAEPRPKAAHAVVLLSPTNR